MAKMRFKLLEGGHSEGGRHWKKGQVVESENDLAAMFGEAKFQRLHAEVSETLPPKPAKTEEPSSKGVDEDEEETQLEQQEVVGEIPPLVQSELGDDVTSEFEQAGKAEVLVFKKGTKFFVTAKADPNKALHKSGMSQARAKEFISDKLEEE